MIGVLDSGSGGLTILSRLIETLPGQRFLYYGDHQNSPYGDKSRPVVQAMVQEAVEVLFDAGCDLVIIACNTACSVALKRIQRQWLPQLYPDTPGQNPKRVLGVVVPTVEMVTGKPWRGFGERARSPLAKDPAKLVAVFGTLRTIASQVYPFEIHKRHAEMRVVQQAIVGLANGIDGDESEQGLRLLIEEAVETVLEISDGELPSDALLGCTHYPLVTPLFQAALGEQVRVFDQRQIVASALERYLQRHPCYRAEGTSQAFTSGDPYLANRIAERFALAVPRFESL